MPKRFLTGILCLLLSVAVQAQKRANSGVANDEVTGDYLGIQSDPSLSPDEPNIRWFHENALIVRKNEAILDKSPLTLQQGKKYYSASDGGFATYRGRFFQKNGEAFVYLRLFESDYIAFPVGGCEPYSKIRVLPVIFLPNGIQIEGVVYKRKVLAPSTRKRMLAMLNKEPMEYSGEHPYNKSLHAPICDNSAGEVAPNASPKPTVLR